MSVSIKDITQKKFDEAIEKELGKKSRKGGTLSRKTVNDAAALALTALREAIPDCDIKLTLLEIQRSFPELLSPKKIIPAIKNTNVELPCLLAMWLSLSMSEIRGLTKSKSVRDNKLYIVETVVDVNGKPIRKAGAKEEARPRVLEIPQYIKQLIDRVDSDIIEPRSSHAIYMAFQKALSAAGLPKMRFHDLRHVNASVMADLNLPTIISQERGGWKTDSTMKRVYQHAFTSSRKAADKKMDDYFEQLINS